MKNIRPISLILMILFLVAGACENLPQIESSESSNLKSGPADSPIVKSYKLYAGQHSLIGWLNVWVEDGDFLVEYEIFEEGWCITETHLQVTELFDEIPQKNGNPIPGKFDYKGEHACETSVTYSTGLDLAPCTHIYIAAHAVVKCKSKEETAWASCCNNCMPFPGKNWATFVTWKIPPCPPKS